MTAEEIERTLLVMLANHSNPYEFREAVVAFTDELALARIPPEKLVEYREARRALHEAQDRANALAEQLPATAAVRIVREVRDERDKKKQQQDKEPG